MGAHAYDRLRQPVAFSGLVDDINNHEADVEVALASQLKAARELFAAAATGKELREIPKEIAAPMPEGQFRIDLSAYHHYLDECKHGNVTYTRLFNTQEQAANVLFFGANFDSGFPLKNLYKALNVVKPDTILVQIPPDVAYSPDYTAPPSTGDPDLDWVKDLERSAADFISSVEYKNKV